jgi:hypothetical protein
MQVSMSWLNCRDPFCFSGTGSVFSHAQHVLILQNYLILVTDYCWATCFDWSLSHLQAVDDSITSLNILILDFRRVQY